VSYQLAQVNIARLLAPLESEQLSSFVAALDPVNASADDAPGFVWRLQSEDGNATGIQAFNWDVQGTAGVIVNMSVWESLEHLAHWVYGDLHRAVLRQRRNWFERVAEATTALWWLPAGHTPNVAEAESRVLHLRSHGPTPHAFTFKQSFASPSQADAETPRTGDDRWLCPT
jgi:heme-degrading monooxygenase HmoA